MAIDQSDCCIFLQGTLNIIIFFHLKPRSAALKCDNSNIQIVLLLDAAIKEGHPPVCSVLVAWNPNLLSSVLQSCQNNSVEVAKANKVLSYLMYKDIAYRDHILLSVAKTFHSEGMKLLTPNSDYEEYSKRFLRNVNIMRYLLSCDPSRGSTSSLHASRTAYTNNNDSARLRLDTLLSRNESNSSEKLLSHRYTVEPENVERINLEVHGLWSVLESWMEILQHEVKSSQSYSPVSEIEGDTLSLLKAEACDLRASATSSPCRRRSSMSRGSANLERLRWSQPALQFTILSEDGMENPDTEEMVTGCTSDHGEGDEEAKGEIALSHTALVGSEWVDIQEAGSCSLEESDVLGRLVNEVTDCSIGAGECSTSAGTQNIESSAVDVTSTSMPSLSVNVDNSESPVDVNQVMDMTGDRLCCLIHGYFLFCQGQSTWKKLKGKMSSFNVFIKKYEEILLLLVSRKPQLIFEHFSFILESPILLTQFLPAIHCQPLADRQKWFYEQLHATKNDTAVDDSNVLNIARESLLNTSCKILADREDTILKENLSIRFIGEEGMGVGVTREWFDLLVKEILNPDCALFTLSNDGSTFQPCSNSFVNPDHLNYFTFAGRIMGLALYHKHLITAYFTRSFYKHILGIPVSYKDVESIDPEYSKSLQWLLDNRIDNLEGLDITFSVNTDAFGQTQEVELKPGGQSIPVTDENKLEYVQLAADLRMTKAIRHQVFAFLKGFYEFVPHSLVSLFDEYELELIMCGIPDDLDLEDWKSNTAYQAGYTAESETILWFWEVVEELTKEEQVKLLQFVTGTSRVPWGGFSNLASGETGSLFTIVRTDGSVDSLPTASTCFNMIKFPEYPSKDVISLKLRTAISCGSQGFEFA